MAEKKEKPRFARIFRRFVMFSLLTGVLTVAGVLTWVANDLPPMSVIEAMETDLSTHIYSADGKLIGTFYNNENRVLVKQHEISTHVYNALIATEDIRFYEHCGIDGQTMAVLVIRNLMRTRSGGSTITMQLSRNLYDQVGDNRTFFRKIQEMIVSGILERKFTKEEILNAYLNTSSFYGNTYGIELGAKALFNKPAADLELHEAALMVGLLKGPSYYNPVTKPERALERRNVVLSQMAKYGFITEAVKDSVQAMDIGLKRGSVSHTSGTAPYFQEQVRQEIKQWAKENGYDIYTSGLKVYTTIDSRMQQYAEEAVEEHLTEYQQIFDDHLKKTGEPWVKEPEILEKLIRQSPRYKNLKAAGMDKQEIEAEFKKKVEMRLWTWKDGEVDTLLSPRDSVIHYMKFLETGFVSIDPTNGHIKAWVGGINYRHFKYDHVNIGKRQVGSTFKPFVYAAALDNGYMPCDKLLNQRVFFEMPDGKVWAPENSDGSVGGYITLREGLAKSLNLCTASLMKKVGPEAVCDLAHELGIKSDLDCVPSLCLGTTDLSVLEMVSAYTTFANQGMHNDPVMITRIEDKNGQVVYSHVPEQRQVLQPKTAYLVISLLKGVVEHPKGTAHSLIWKYKFPTEIGGKTGTTQNHSDGWFMGVTPHLVSGAWVGCADRRVRFKTITYGQGARLALPIWALYMQKVYADPSINLPTAPFEKPKDFNTDLNCNDAEQPGQDQDHDQNPVWGSAY